jgi:hypothetical protein
LRQLCRRKHSVVACTAAALGAQLPLALLREEQRYIVTVCAICIPVCPLAAAAALPVLPLMLS